MKKIKKVLPPLSAALCALCLVLLLIDLVSPGLSLFLKPWVKLYLLVPCVSVIAASAVKLSQTRRRLRRRLAKQGKA